MAIYRGVGGAGDATVDASSASTLATTKAAEAATSAANAAISATAAATSATTAEGYVDTFDDKYLGSKTSAPTVDNDGDALTDGALYFNTTSNIMFVYDLGTAAWLQLTLTSSNQTNVNTVATNISNVNSVAGNSTNINSVAGNSTNINAVAGDATDIGTVAGSIANVNSVAGNATNINSVAGNSTNINTVAADETDIGTVSTNIANVNTVATNVTSVNSFALTYLGAHSSAPTTSNVGALYYNTTSNNLFVWSGSAWDEAAFSVTGAVTAFNSRTGAVTLSSGDVTTALGFTPGAALGFTPVTNARSITINGVAQDLTADRTYTITANGLLPSQTGNSGKVLSTDGSNLSWIADSEGVASFNSRTGAVTLSSADVTTALSTGAIATAKIADDAITADKLANSINTEITANTAKVTNATHTGDVTGATALTIADNAVTTAKINNDAVTTDKINLVSAGTTPSLEAKGTSGDTAGFIQLNCEENSHGIKLKGPPHSAGASYTLTFPDNDGSANEFLQTNGSGGMTWAVAATLGAQAFSGVQTFTNITETQTTKSASFTPNLSTEGTVFSCSGAMTITMPTAAAGKSFTIVHASGSSITWAGTIKWNGGSAPSAAAAIEIYVFYSDGTNWYGMQSGTGFA